MYFRYWQNPEREILSKTKRKVKESYIENFIKKLWHGQDSEAGARHLSPGRELRASHVLESLLKNQWKAILPSFFGSCSSKTSHFLLRVLLSSIKIWCKTPQEKKKTSSYYWNWKEIPRLFFSCVKIAINTHWMLHVKNMPLTSQLLSSAFFFFFFKKFTNSKNEQRYKRMCQ